jgi:hypothetical protein
MLACYAILTAIHILAIIVTGVLWVIVDLNPKSMLREQLRDIRAVHFGSLYLVPWFLGLAWAFDRLQVPWPHWVFFPAGLGALVSFSGIGYLFSRPAGLDPFYYWTRGIPLVLAMIGLACLASAMLWTAGILCIYAWEQPAIG